MHRFVRTALGALAALALFAGFALASPVSAQELESGTWTGTVEPPDGGIIDVEFAVEWGDEPSIVIMAMGESLAVLDIEVTEEALMFAFDADEYVACELLATDDGGYEGECVGSDGTPGYMTMTPPDGR